MQDAFLLRTLLRGGCFIHMERNRAVLDCRAILELEQPHLQSEEEQFQNTSIRPIIKFQHDLIISMVHGHRFFHKAMLGTDTQEQYRAKLKTFLVGQKELRQQLVGIVIGLFTTDELKRYQLHPAEYQRRIIQIITQRVLDQLGSK
jgi:hypothetical protein